MEVVLGSRVEDATAQGVTLSGQHVPARTVLWAAGVTASPAAAWLVVKPDRSGRVTVGADLGVAELDGVYAIGDTAASDGWAGQAVPGLAPAAKQGGAHVARVIRTRLAGQTAPRAFRSHHLGSLATIGRQSAVANFGFLRVRGALAWWLWAGAVGVGLPDLPPRHPADYWRVMIARGPGVACGGLRGDRRVIWRAAWISR